MLIDRTHIPALCRSCQRGNNAIVGNMFGITKEEGSECSLCVFWRESTTDQLIASALVECDNLVRCQYGGSVIAHFFSSIDDLNQVSFVLDQVNHFFKVLRITFDREECFMKLLISLGLGGNSEEGMN